MSAQNSAGIQTLLDAEREAQKIVQQAREYRTKRVKDARNEAQKEIDDYRNEKDAEYQKFEKEVRSRVRPSLSGIQKADNGAAQLRQPKGRGGRKEGDRCQDPRD
ncbi:hypothetical protein ACJBU6_08796 [Exserohilum turcicum]